MNDISFLEELENRLKKLETDLNTGDNINPDKSDETKRHLKFGILLDEICDPIEDSSKKN